MHYEVLKEEWGCGFRDWTENCQSKVTQSLLLLWGRSFCGKMKAVVWIRMLSEMKHAKCDYVQFNQKQ